MSISSWLTREKRKTHYQRLHEQAQAEPRFEALAKLLNDGVPELGWAGDPWLKVVYNKLFDRLEIIDTHPRFNGQYDTVFVTQPGDALMADPYSMIRRVKMCDHRTRSVDEFLNMLDEQQEQFEKQREREDEERIAEHADRLEGAIRKDAAGLYGVMSRRYF